MVRIQAVLFDRDGVLVTFNLARAKLFFDPILPISLYEIAAKWEAYGQRYGFPTSLVEEEAFFAGFWGALADEFGLSAKLRDELLAFEYVSCLSAYVDGLHALAFARAQGLKVGVLSNFSLASLEKSLLATGYGGLFDAACAATVIGAAKPGAGAYLHTAAQVGAPPETCLFFDDEIACVEGARAVGMHAYWVNRQAAAHDFAAGMVADLGALPLLLAQYPR
jgi:putative hydrolase of the HAD superfamily